MADRYIRSQPINAIKKKVHKEQDTDDSDNDIAIVPFRNKNDLKQEANLTDDEFVILAQTNTMRLEENYNSGYYGISNDFDPHAPYYSETTVQWRLGVTPLNLNGAKTYVIKFSNLITSDLLQQYLDAGVVQFNLLDFSVQMVPIQFLESTAGAATMKISQGNYFETHIVKVYETVEAQLNEEITGLQFTVDTKLPLAQILDTPIATITYKWYGAKFPKEPSSPLAIHQLMLINANLSTVVSEPIKVRTTVRKDNPLPSKFL